MHWLGCSSIKIVLVISRTLNWRGSFCSYYKDPALSQSQIMISHIDSDDTRLTLSHYRTEVN